jgi:large conductance mechanosensitive channel
MSMITEFKTFIARGNVIDMAVGIVIGAAFTAIVSSMVSDIINPVIGMLLGGLDFSNYYFDLSMGGYESLEAAKKAGAPLIMYGLFINAVIKFLIVAFVVFIMLKQINRLKAGLIEADASKPAPPPPEDIQLLREIRDALAAKK